MRHFATEDDFRAEATPSDCIALLAQHGLGADDTYIDADLTTVCVFDVDVDDWVRLDDADAVCDWLGY